MLQSYSLINIILSMIVCLAINCFCFFFPFVLAQGYPNLPRTFQELYSREATHNKHKSFPKCWQAEQAGSGVGGTVTVKIIIFMLTYLVKDHSCSCFLVGTTRAFIVISTVTDTYQPVKAPEAAIATGETHPLTFAMWQSHHYCLSYCCSVKEKEFPSAGTKQWTIYILRF